MTKRTRRNRTPGFKAKVALAAMKGDKTLAELAQLFGMCTRTRSRNGEARCWKGRLACSARTRARRSQALSVDMKALSRQDQRADPEERFFRRGAHRRGIAERKAMIDREHDLPISRQAEALGVSRGASTTTPANLGRGFADHAPPRRTASLLPVSGRRMLRDSLIRKGVSIGGAHVASLMKRIGIAAIYRRPNTRNPRPATRSTPTCCAGLKIERADQVWAMDITYVPMARGFVYLTAVVDLFSRRILAHRISITMEAAFCVEALEEALAKHGRPEIFNTDQGSQGAFGRSSQHDLCWLRGETGQAPLRVFSNQASFRGRELRGPAATAAISLALCMRRISSLWGSTGAAVR